MKKKLVLVCLVTFAISCLTGCGKRETASSKENLYTQTLMEQSASAVGYPDTSNYFEKSQLKEIYELRDDPHLICYWYTKNDMTGKWVYQGKCVGYGIPYTTQFTQPETLQRAALPALNMSGQDKGYNEYYTEVLPQADPNGLYSSPSTSATWILSVDEDGNISPTYVESEITVSQTKLSARLCEDWSLPDSYEKLSDKAKIKGSVSYEAPVILKDKTSESSEISESEE